MHKVEVARGNLRFSAAHFISFGGKCERLHGHNYAVSVVLEGELTEDRYVFDFVDLKKIVRQICDQLDHYFLLPIASEHLEIKEASGEWVIRLENRRYVFPAEDVLVLPIDNITAERLAEYICGQILEMVPEHERANLSLITVGVEEAPGQTAFYRHSFQHDEIPRKIP
jgi:6-pyruvoyltetrahydropterin/6-carboxytetrahydropterin synthase